MNDFHSEQKPLVGWLEFIIGIAEVTLISAGLLSIALTITTILGD